MGRLYRFQLTECTAVLKKRPRRKRQKPLNRNRRRVRRLNQQRVRLLNLASPTPNRCDKFSLRLKYGKWRSHSRLHGLWTEAILLRLLPRAEKRSARPTQPAGIQILPFW